MSKQNSAHRPPRTALYVPADNVRALAKIGQNNTLTACDEIILDLEDAVASTNKAQARANIAQNTVSAQNYVLRINSLEDISHLIADLNFVRSTEHKRLLVPKINNEDDVRRLAAFLRPHTLTELWFMIETPHAQLHAEGLAKEAQRQNLPLTTFVWGTNDLATAMGKTCGFAEAEHDQLAHNIVLKARSLQIAILDGVENNLEDQAIRLSAQKAVHLGFDGKTLIHPKQIEPVNQAFSLKEEEMEDLKGRLEAFETARREGKSVATYKGELVEELHARAAQKRLQENQAKA